MRLIHVQRDYLELLKQGALSSEESSELFSELSKALESNVWFYTSLTDLIYAVVPSDSSRFPSFERVSAATREIISVFSELMSTLKGESASLRDLIIIFRGRINGIPCAALKTFLDLPLSKHYNIPCILMWIGERQKHISLKEKVLCMLSLLDFMHAADPALLRVHPFYDVRGPLPLKEGLGV